MFTLLRRFLVDDGDAVLRSGRAATVEKEFDIKKRVLRDINKKEWDFSILREYNDYLEEVETIIYNLTNNVGVSATKKWNFKSSLRRRNKKQK
jgi:hypothetical protein